MPVELPAFFFTHHAAFKEVLEINILIELDKSFPFLVKLLDRTLFWERLGAK